MRVIGTAGHVDHGKSTLVQALTGTDPDRLKEEKSRGMTIELGFAWFDLPRYLDGEATDQLDHVGIVDVPGHIDFIKNMLAGVGGIDTAVLVIAADEGVMPQTREHLAILDLLAVPAAVVALTKVDLIDDPEWLDLIELDIAELLQPTRYADAPVVRVSATTGAGLGDLRNAVAATLGALPPRRNRARPRLPVDRIFSLSGFGTVVTGTLSDGHFRVGDAVEILPSGREGRVRGLQTHGRQIWQGEPGSRLAMNLTGVGTDEISRGDVVVAPGSLRPTVLVDLSFRMLADAEKPLVHNQAVDFFVGASEVPARVRLLGVEELGPGAEGWLQLRLERPIVTAAGDRFILRRPSPSVTLGGGVVLSPHPRRRWKRFDPRVIERLQTLAQGTPDEILLQTLTRQPFLNERDLLGQSGLDLELGAGALAELQQNRALVALGAATPRFATLETMDELTAHLTAMLADYHAAHPLRRGMPRQEARNRLRLPTGESLDLRLFNDFVDLAVTQALIGADDGQIWLADFAVTPTLHQQTMVDTLLARFADSPHAPPSAAESLHALGDDQALLEMMIEQGMLVRLGSGVLFRRTDFSTMTDQVTAYITEHGAITLAQTRDLFGTSRKYAQALLEELDARRITRRDGDLRVLRGG